MSKVRLRDNDNNIIDVSKIKECWLSQAGSTFYIRYNFENSDGSHSAEYNTKEARDADYLKIEYILTNQNNKKESKMTELFTDFKGFIKQHKSIFYWLAIIALVDHFIFNGTFREKLKGIVQSLIGKLEKQVEDAR